MTTTAPVPSFFACSNAPLKSGLGVGATFTVCVWRPRARAASSFSRNKAGVTAVSPSRVTRASPGITSFRISSCFLACCGSNVVKPVTLLPGRSKSSTNPASAGSKTSANTIGTSDVARFAARAAIPPPATITSTFRLTRSAAALGNRSSRSSWDPRLSIVMFRPSTYPRLASAVRKTSSKRSEPRKPIRWFWPTFSRLSDFCDIRQIPRIFETTIACRDGFGNGKSRPEPARGDRNRCRQPLALRDFPDGRGRCFAADVPGDRGDGVHSQGGFPSDTSKVDPDRGGTCPLNDHSDVRLRASPREDHNGRSAGRHRLQTTAFSPLTPRGWFLGNGRNGASAPEVGGRQERPLRVVWGNSNRDAAASPAESTRGYRCAKMPHPV